MAARTLYVSRVLENASDLIAWAKSQGFATTMQPGDLHVTVAYSKEPFDWGGLRPEIGHQLAALGGRAVKGFGEAIVLTFESPELHARWQEMRTAGASWDFPTYQPHVTFTYEAGSVDLAKVQPYRGPLMFGPEVFAEIDEDWSSGVHEKTHFSPFRGIGSMSDFFVAPFEVKNAGAPNAGEFEGYGAVFNTVDAHGDIILPGAFREGLSERKASGRKIAMHLNHGLPQLGGRRAVGSYQVVEEDSRGLHVKGRVAGMGTETGRYLHASLLDGAYTGLSIGFRVRPNGAENVKGTDGSRRRLKAVNVEEISIVDDPAHADAIIMQVKAVSGLIDRDRARASISALAALHNATLTGGNAPTVAQRAEIMSHLRDLHEVAVGEPMPDFGMKAAPTTIRECEDALRDAGFTRAQAARFAATVFPTLPAHRDDEGGQANPPEAKSAVSQALAEIAAFRL